MHAFPNKLGGQKLSEKKASVGASGTSEHFASVVIKQNKDKDMGGLSTKTTTAISLTC